ncbi:MAG: hypothetical protein BGO01_15580 [Armatimonadetes bacterium 55-13]|nr:RNA polymerase sigma factor [Armatimonadota bacterium]OJU65283.1 MAG: hypothetical protein BGO01_15580 [Armatimonadetes bacterium 55-13]
MATEEGGQPLNDFERAQSIAAGNEFAIREFVSEHYPSVLRFATHLTRNVEDAEDLTQQAFIKARASIAGFRGQSTLRTWLHRFVFHEYTHWRRRQRPSLRLTERAVKEEGFQTCEDGLVLLNALHKVPPKLREAFLLFEVQQLSLEETAQVLRIPKGTVKSRLHHARTHLRQILESAEENFVHGEKAIECR